MMGFLVCSQYCSDPMILHANIWQGLCDHEESLLCLIQIHFTKSIPTTDGSDNDKVFHKILVFLNDGFPKEFELWGYRNWDTCLNTLNMNNSSITTTLKLQLNLISWQTLCLNLAKYNCITGWGSGLSLWMTGLSLLGHLIQPRSAHPRPCQRRAAAALMHLRINLTLPAASRRRCFLSLTNLGLIYEAAFS